MKRILLTGANGQIGVELAAHLRDQYGRDNVLTTDIKDRPSGSAQAATDFGPFELLDARDGAAMEKTAKAFRADTIFHLAGLLSANGEAKPQLAWDININGLHAVLETARSLGCGVFFPSSIAAFGPTTPHKNTPQDTIQRPTTIYGVTKVTGELLCDYYHMKYGIDTRGVRFPGLISYAALPGGGTTDYAVHIYYQAAAKGSYSCYIAKGSYMDMMYMPDALSAVAKLMEADPAKLKHRNAFNISAMSFEPEEIAASIRRRIPDFKMTYDVDPVRQGIADSWPDSLDCSAAVEEWGFAPKYSLDAMTDDMLTRVPRG